MWMLAIFCPYIALFVLKRYWEATIITLMWLFMFPFLMLSIFFPPFWLLVPVFGGLLSVTPIIAGLYTAQYYRQQGNIYLANSIMQAAQLVSGKEGVTAQTFTAPTPAPSSQEMDKPTTYETHEPQTEYERRSSRNLGSSWSEIHPQDKKIVILLVVALISMAGFTVYKGTEQCIYHMIGGIAAAMSGDKNYPEPPLYCKSLEPIHALFRWLSYSHPI